MNHIVKKRRVLLPFCLIFMLAACCGPDLAIKRVQQFIASQNIDKTDTRWKTKLVKPELLPFTQGKAYFWNLETTAGAIKIKLLHKDAPMHVSSTMYLTKLGFYDDLTFHRVIPGFMAQGGDPLGNGRGNPGYKYAGEFDGDARHTKAGMLSMANAGPNTDGSQFFITFQPTVFLDGKHTVFGEVTQGLETTLKAIEKLGSRGGRTTEEIKIIKATISVENDNTKTK
ncbi:peptidylprolyl isomerase [Litorilituus lipolyticus]|uniref:Peptidyl-prolyl cis-trans isomerase n=1 Tax=Litorilituus lipolyticus TaxID=2491017 RepID=A0A502KXL0_9GAMM|nr:peptidylprolyl isomerase [Litorilituus lipolyticus]TPH15854.1 peptidylprolyl isomerase [Litorilituus lipolyticus]